MRRRATGVALLPRSKAAWSREAGAFALAVCNQMAVAV